LLSFFSWLPLQRHRARDLEAFADRATIDQDFHDVKEGLGNWTTTSAKRLDQPGGIQPEFWMHTLVELWAWHKTQAELCDRSDFPWDDFERRPSHANRRKALRRFIMRHELSTLKAPGRLPRKFIQLAEKSMSFTAYPTWLMFPS